MYEIHTPTHTVRTTAPTYEEALRVADALTRQDRILHTVHSAAAGAR